MKKTLAILLTLALCLALAACGGSQSSVSGQTSQSSQTAATPEPTPEPTTDPNFDIGVTSGGRYENSYFKLGCELDDSWVFATEEELLNMGATTAEYVDDEELKQLLMDADSFFDMSAEKDGGQESVNAVVENVGLRNSLLITEQAYVDASLDNLKTQMESMGMTDVEAEKITVDFAGASHPGIRLTAKISGLDYFMEDVVIKQGQWVMVVTAGSLFEDDTANILNSFFAVN